MTPRPFEPQVFKVPFPSDFSHEPDKDVLLRATVMCATAEAIYANMQSKGQTPVISDMDRNVAHDVFEGGTSVTKVRTTAIALHLTALLQAYDMEVVKNAQQLRNFCTNILIEKAGKGKTETVQLRAIEMIAKIKDVALFDERSTVTVEHMTTPELQNSLREKINRIYGVTSQTITDITPTAVHPDDAPPAHSNP